MKICITVNSNNIVNQVAKCLGKNHNPLNGIIIDTDLNLNNIQDRYKYENGKLIALTDYEIKDNSLKESNEEEITPTLEERVEAVENQNSEIIYALMNGGLI